MKRIVAAIIACAVTCAAGAPSHASSGVRIYLKSGMSMDAEDCSDSGSHMVCAAGGGTFILEKDDIDRIRRVSSSSSIDGASRGAEPAGEATEMPAAAPPAEGAEADKGLSAGDKERLTRITQRKTELQGEREALLRERERIQEDYRKLPDWMTTKEYADIQKEISDLDARISRFNEEVARLNEEERQIIGEAESRGTRAK